VHALHGAYDEQFIQDGSEAHEEKEEREDSPPEQKMENMDARRIAARVTHPTKTNS
jgi:hypothetical protein